MNQSKDPFARKGLQLLVDGAEPERLREVLEVEINTFEDEMRLSARIWEAAGGYSPTIGILGAVMGLIHVMENLTDPSKLGAGIAVAFVATIYGVGLANLVFLPMANKLKAHINRLVVQREMIVDGLVGIANGDNPRIIESRLKGYIF
jgi:chemotaxis protein MotA